MGSSLYKLIIQYHIWKYELTLVSCTSPTHATPFGIATASIVGATEQAKGADGIVSMVERDQSCMCD